MSIISPKRISLRLFTIIVIMYCAASAQEDYSKWTHSFNIYFNTDSSGIPISVVLKQFPVLVRLDNSNFPFFDSVKTLGADIRFSNSSGGHLSYEIERWGNNTGTNDTAVIWVKTDSIVPGSSLQHIVMYWGNKNAADSSKSSGVFSNANWYSGVYHLGEDDKSGLGTAGYYKDATGVNNGYDSIGSNTDNSGYIGRGHKFGKRDVIPVGKYNPSTTRMTVSSWVKWSGDTSYWQAIVSKRDNPSTVYWELNYAVHVTPKGISAVNNTATYGFGKPMFSANVWHHVAMSSVNGSANETILYVDGVMAGSTTLSWGNASGAEILIGNTDAYRSGTEGNDSGGTYWRGYLDEVRLENAAHSADWIKICYENQRVDNQLLMKLRSKPVITIEPSGIPMPANDTTSLSIGVFGDSLSFQWYRSTDAETWTAAPGDSGKSIYTFVTLPGDSGSFYRCIVSNDLGSDTSVSVNLRMCNQIVFTKHPQSILDCPIGRDVTFSVEVDNLYCSFQWEKSFDGVEWSAIDNENKLVFNYSIHSETIDRKYRCKVMSSCDTAWSDVANLTVCLPVTVSMKPIGQSAIEGKTVSFTTGTKKSAKSFQWYSKKSADTAWLPVTGAVDSIYSLAADTSVNGSLFYCIAKGTCDSVKTDSVLLTVYRKVRASFSLSDSAGQAPFGVTLTDMSTGNIDKWKWIYSDTTADSGSISKNQARLYKTAASYTIKLIVSGTGGIDSMIKTVRVYPAGANPVIISGRMIKPDKVQLIYKNLSSLQTALPSIPFATEIKLLYRAGTVPTDTLSPVRILKVYDAAAFKAHGNEYCDTVTVEPISLPDSIYGFSTQIVWNDGKTAALGSHNGCTILMRNNEQPLNRLALKGIYVPWDSLDFIIDSVQTIDWYVIDSVAIWYGIGIDSVPDFSRQTGVKKWGYDEIVNSSANGKFICRIFDKQFNTDIIRLNCAVILIGRNGVRSLPVMNFFNIGRVRPENAVILQAHAVNANTVELSWNRQSGIEKMRIYYRTQFSVPLEYSFSGLDSIVVSPDSVSCTLNQLNQKTRYYFGAQIFRDGMWSKVTNVSSATDSTPAASVSTITNSIKIQKAVFDSINGVLNVSWTVDTSIGSNLQAGLSYTTAANKCGDSAVFQIVDIMQSVGTSVIAFREAIEFDNDYTILIRLRKNNESWTDPTPDSKAIIHISKFGLQTVNYTFKSVIDTTFWVNQTIRFTTPAVTASEPRIISMKIRAFIPDTTFLKGFINVSNGFSFTQQVVSDSIFIGLKCIAIPAKFSIKDVRMYRFDGANFLLESKTSIDSSGMFVSVKTADLFRPFIALIDTQAPVITLISKRDTIVNINESFQDTLKIQDNIANLAWYYNCSTGADPFFKSGYKSGKVTISGCSDTVIVNSQKNLIGEDGARSIVYTSDGHTVTKLDLSRRVRIDKCDTVQTIPLKWIPLKVTAILDTPAVSSALRHFYNSVGESAYDNKKLRLFRWHQSASNMTDSNKWIEYSPANEREFSLTSGQLYWIKTREPLNINLGTGLSMSFSDTVKIKLIPENWTDFALPFHYGMKVGDIISASRKYSSKVDSMQLYQWKMDTVSGRYTSCPFFVPNLYYSGVTDSTLVMSSEAKTGFTAWNPTKDTIILIFAPVFSDTEILTPVLTKSDVNNGWAVKVNVRLHDGHTLSPIFCGLDKRSLQDSYFPMPPSMEKVNAGVVGNRGKICAHMIADKLQNGGSSYVLAFTNNSDESQQITCTMETFGAFNPDAKTAFYSAPDNTWSYADSTGTVSFNVDKGSTAYRQLLIGSDEFIHNFYSKITQCKLALTKIYPNPIRGSVMVEYSLPFAPVKKIDFVIVNMLGRVVWRKTDKRESFAGGLRSFRWNVTNNNGEKISSGIYILRMAASNDKDIMIGQFDRVLTVLP